ncbi:hypothetical protein TNCT_494531 [Trichonephila clavata]|uniref:Uncharacterized protein n=1 Tax=Trichonephila clavata TaxID=2740835 RepID=A0A8X6H1H4_TRICU|nr:hypothetical protein TNCT_494531 [Trichonephila clavata]
MTTIPCTPERKDEEKKSNLFIPSFIIDIRRKGYKILINTDHLTLALSSCSTPQQIEYRNDGIKLILFPSVDERMGKRCSEAFERDRCLHFSLFGECKHFCLTHSLRVPLKVLL